MKRGSDLSPAWVRRTGDGIPIDFAAWPKMLGSGTRWIQ